MDQGYCGAIQEKELRPSLNLGVVAIEKGAFGTPPTKVTNFTYIVLSYRISKYQSLHTLKRPFFSWKYLM